MQIVALLHTPDIKCTDSKKCSHAWLHKVKKRLCHMSLQQLLSNLLRSALMTQPYASFVKVKFITHNTNCNKKISHYLIKILPTYLPIHLLEKMRKSYFFLLPTMCWIKSLQTLTWTWNTLPLLLFSLLSLPSSGFKQVKQRWGGVQPNWVFGSIHGSIQWQSVCPCKSHWSATKSSLDHRGLCLGPKASPDRWCCPGYWQGDCLPQRDSGGNS